MHALLCYTCIFGLASTLIGLMKLWPRTSLQKATMILSSRSHTKPLAYPQGVRGFKIPPLNLNDF